MKRNWQNKTTMTTFVIKNVTANIHTLKLQHNPGILKMAQPFCTIYKIQNYIGKRSGPETEREKHKYSPWVLRTGNTHPSVGHSLLLLWHS